ncbi:MAG: hypothetical protein BM563_04895 [Bacteroidetes bacterium MedPE-SWsnd-G1]|nr:MAG: hypothetical protein BM563_04895 [Bacteroidetes bacterium MedPE-SWsnd-G1]
MENKTGKYFKYAIGEIVLVVIGILIALQINNWNENKKSRRFEVKILKELRNDLKSNYLELAEIRENYEVLIIKSDSLIDVLKNQNFDLTIHSNLLRGLDYGNFGVYNVSSTTYKFIESKGFELLTNDSLRISISDIYERRIFNIVNNHKRYRSFYEEETRPYLSSRFLLPKFGVPIPLNKASVENQTFKNLVNRRSRLLEVTKRNTQGCLDDMDILIQRIDQEIMKNDIK